MKRFLMLWVAFCTTEAVVAQIPNPDFEQWITKVRNLPVGWRVFGNSQKVAGYKSANAVRISMDKDRPNEPGAVIFGNPDQGFTGGVPFNGRPDSVAGFFKYHMDGNDSCWVLVFLKRNGNFIAQNVFNLAGGDSTRFVRLAFHISYSDTGRADSVIVGVSSSNPNNLHPASIMTADSLHFIGGISGGVIPNGNFENWTSLSKDLPVGWSTSDAFGSVSAQAVTRTTDRVFGNYAVRIENPDLGGGQFGMGYIMAGRQGNDGPEPGFKMTGRDTLLYFNYKFQPKNNDTMMAMIMVYKNGKRMGAGTFTQSATVSVYTQAQIKIHYDSAASIMPDSAVLFFVAFQGGGQPHGASVLYVDGIQFTNPMNTVRKTNTNHVTAWPVPADQELFVSFVETIHSLYLTDVSGRMVLSVQDTVSGQLKLDVSSVPDGLYNLILQTETGTICRKLQVLHR